MGVGLNSCISQATVSAWFFEEMSARYGNASSTAKVAFSLRP